MKQGERSQNRRNTAHMEMEGDDGPKRRKSETKPDVHHTGTGGFHRTQPRGKIQAYIGPPRVQYCNGALATKITRSRWASAKCGPRRKPLQEKSRLLRAWRLYVAHLSSWREEDGAAQVDSEQAVT
jgi:hypothetical protein